jgi:hypothetical protein
VEGHDEVDAPIVASYVDGDVGHNLPVNLANWLYREHLRYLKDGSEREGRIPKSVKVSKRSRPEGVDIVIEDKSYALSFSQRPTYAPDNHDLYGNLELKQDEALLLQLKCLGVDERYGGTKWSVIDIGAFLEGPCVDEINRFAHQVFSLAGQRQPTVIRPTLPTTWDVTPCFHPSFPATT